MPQSIAISGDTLTIPQLEAMVVELHQQLHLSPSASAAVASSHACLLRLASQDVVYGVNTGFGPLASVVLGQPQLVDLQYNLIRSHAAGLGEPIAERFVLAAMVARLNTLAKGYSGVSPQLLALLEVFINRRIIPVVPEHGAVGASGDLVQLAHIALSLIGEGEVFFEGQRVHTREVLNRLGIAPHALRPKEGLALINGTAMMTGIAALLCADVERLIDLAIRNGALALEIVQAFDDGIAPELQAVRPHHGQQYVAARLRDLLKASRRLRLRQAALHSHGGRNSPHTLDAPVQEVYSIRCIPQIVGPVYDTLVSVKQRVEVELNAVTDNPVILWREERAVHGGNFHGDYIALAVDELKIAVIKLAMLSERRINFLLNPNIPHPWPPFLNRRTPGFNLGLQGLQFVATSTVAHNQTLGYPQYLHSITTNGDNQDVVSLGTDAALIAGRVVRNAFAVLAIESAVLAQAVDCLGITSELADASLALWREVRAITPAVDEDRVIAVELQQLCRRLESADCPIYATASALPAAEEPIGI